jgi:hypothetical protein
MDQYDKFNEQWHERQKIPANYLAEVGRDDNWFHISTSNRAISAEKPHTSRSNLRSSADATKKQKGGRTRRREQASKRFTPKS